MVSRTILSRMRLPIPPQRLVFTAYEKYINTLADILQHFFAPYLCLYFAV